MKAVARITQNSNPRYKNRAATSAQRASTGINLIRAKTEECKCDGEHHTSDRKGLHCSGVEKVISADLNIEEVSGGIVIDLLRQ